MNEKDIIDASIEEIVIEDATELEPAHSQSEELPEQFTISKIAELTGENASTLRVMVQDMEKRGILSTSNKEANKHRRLTYNDYERISKAVTLHQRGLSTTAAINEVAMEVQTGCERTTTDLYYQGQRNGAEIEALAKFTQALNAVMNENNRLTMQKIEQMIAISDEGNKHSEKIEDELRNLRKIVTSQSEAMAVQAKEIADLKTELHKQGENNKRKKFLGLF